MPCFKPAEERLTLLLGGNAAGDFKLKSLLIYYSITPRGLKGFSKKFSPVIWRANKKAWVTMVVFEDWFKNYFCPAVHLYCTQYNQAHRAFVLDNAPGHPTTNEDLSDKVKEVFLPSHKTSLLHPTDQGVIATFKTILMQNICLGH